MEERGWTESEKGGGGVGGGTDERKRKREGEVKFVSVREIDACPETGAAAEIPYERAAEESRRPGGRRAVQLHDRSDRPPATQL